MISEAAKRLLMYTLAPIDYDYEYLTTTEKSLVTREEFDKVVVEELEVTIQVVGEDGKPLKLK